MKQRFYLRLAQGVVLLLSCGLFSVSEAVAQVEYALDDAHNHDGTHVEGQENCGANYLMPKETVRLGSHSFLILGEDGPQHLLLDHRSGTPPHNYQYIFRVRVDEAEMAIYRTLLKKSRVALPAVTTIHFDEKRKQVGRTFFCNHDLGKIFGHEKKPGDPFEKLFPIHASWQVNADFEGAFPIVETVVPEKPLTIERNDVELILARYLPSYLEQSSFRKTLKAEGAVATARLSHGPIRHDEASTTASQRSSYVAWGALQSNGETCPANFYLKGVLPAKTKHAFLLLAEAGPDSILAVHLYDQAPQNFQATIELGVSAEEMKVFRDARRLSKKPILFLPNQYFCMRDLKKLVKNSALALEGEMHRDSDFLEFQPGPVVGKLKVDTGKIRVLVNRTLESLMDPHAVARDVFGFVDIQALDPSIRVQARYSKDWNFIGRPIAGYSANRCYLTKKAAEALVAVQKEVVRKGLSLLIFDCFRPQRAVDEFVKWTKSTNETKMKTVFYPDEDRAKLIQRGYIDARSGHSRGSTVDLTLIRISKSQEFNFDPGQREPVTDCRATSRLHETGQVDMGTTYDCFSVKAHTGDKTISAESQANRALLKAALEKQGFANYPKEWWHFRLKDEAYPRDYFDFEVR